MIDMIEIINTT